MKKLIIGLLLIAQYQLLVAQGVGIGTTNPHSSAQLDVTSITKGLLIPRMTGAQRVAIGTPAAGLLVYQTNVETTPPSSVGFYLYDAGAWKRIARADEIPSSSSWTVSGSNQYSNVPGNVGIGINPPDASAKLDISSTTGGLLIPRMSIGQRYDIPNPARGLLVYDTSLDDFFYYDGTAWQRLLNESYDYWNKSSSRNWVYNISDSIGLGTSSPNTKLHVVGGVRATGVITSTNSMVIDDAAAILTLQNSGDDKGFLQLSGDNVRIGTFSTNTFGDFVIRTGGSDNLLVDENGDVGIGPITNPLTKLQILAGQDAGLSSSTNGYLMMSHANSSNTNLIIDNNEIIVRNGYSTPGNLYLQNNGGDLTIGARTTINKDGEAIKLDGNDPAINLYDNGVQKGYIWQTNNNLQIGTSDALGKVIINTNKMQISTSVNLPDGYRLGVGGKILCEEVRVKLQSSGWPDYVFSDDYKLMSLTDLAKYIQEHKHMPNIPPAKEIETNGLELGDMQKRLMEKIEELTLYILKQQQDIEALKTAIHKK